MRLYRLVPYYRVESEAAVLSHLRGNTRIPVACVIAWDLSAVIGLGFEWALLEKVDGVTLYDVLRKVPWESKIKIVAAPAPLLGQLRDQKVDRSGSLYSKGRERHPDREHQAETGSPTHGL